MKKTQLCLMMIFFALITVTAKAQKNSESLENCVGQGKFIFDVYYGYPYVMGSYIKCIVLK